MEHWNGFEEEFKEMAEQLGDKRFLENNVNSEYLEKRRTGEIVLEGICTTKKMDIKDTYTMTEIFDEIYKERYEDPARSKKKLNEMFQALFDCGYKEILVKEKNEYMVGEKGKILMEFLVRTRSTPTGRKLLGREFNNIDFQVENMLLYHIAMFIEELDGQDRDGEKRNKTSDELCRIIMKKFDIDSGTLELRKAIADFNYWMEEVVQDDELKPSHGEIAKKIDEFAMNLL